MVFGKGNAQLVAAWRARLQLHVLSDGRQARVPPAAEAASAETVDAIVTFEFEVVLVRQTSPPFASEWSGKQSPHLTFPPHDIFPLQCQLPRQGTCATPPARG